LGIGSGAGAATLTFNLSPSPANTTSNPYPGVTGIEIAEYTASEPTLTLAGTNVNGIYHPATTLSLANILSSGPSNIFDGIYAKVNITLAGEEYEITFFPAMLNTFWGDSEVPPLPKVINMDDVRFITDPFKIYFTGFTISSVSPQAFLYTHWYNDTIINSQVVPLSPAVWLLGAGLLRLVRWSRERKG
jgi:hypothetical protein